ncbi:MAG: replication-associated recombination protein A, partial [Clostridia bacterium]
PIVKSCVDSALMVGLPEAAIPLADAAVMVAQSPKSNSAYLGIKEAIADVESGNFGDIPRTLKNKHFDGAEVERKGQFYEYPHAYPNHYIEQQYLPNVLKNKKYYTEGENKNEQGFKAYWDKIKRG